MYRTDTITLHAPLQIPRTDVDAPRCPEHLRDDRYRRLLGERAWGRLPAAVRRRFGKRLSSGTSIVYQGEVTRFTMTGAGRLWAWVARLIGSPLPFDRSSVTRSAVVVVTEDAASGGQIWIRHYGRATGFPQTVSSAKRFAGPTGLEEHIGYGIGMALRLEATHRALYFRSAGFFLKIGPWRMPVPEWMGPGTLLIGHEELGGGRFVFSLRLTHPLLGVIIAQDAVFRDGEIVGG